MTQLFMVYIVRVIFRNTWIESGQYGFSCCWNNVCIGRHSFPPVDISFSGKMIVSGQ